MLYHRAEDGRHNRRVHRAYRGYFRATSFLDDVLDVTIGVKKLGRSSLTFAIVADCGGQHRLTVTLIMCWMEGRTAAPWPEEMRAKPAAFMAG